MPTGSKQADCSRSSVEASRVALRQGPWGGERSGRVASQPRSRSGNRTLKDPGAVMVLPCTGATAAPVRHSWKVSRVHVLLPRQTQKGLRSGYGTRGAAKPPPNPERGTAEPRRARPTARRRSPADPARSGAARGGPAPRPGRGCRARRRDSRRASGTGCGDAGPARKPRRPTARRTPHSPRRRCRRRSPPQMRAGTRMGTERRSPPER